MQSCNYVNQHYFKLTEKEKECANYFKYHPQVANCPICFKKSSVQYVVKYTKSKTMERVANITGLIKCNPYGTKCKANDRFYCKSCDLYF